MRKNQFWKMDSFRGEKADDINIESRESIDVGPVERIHVSVPAGEAALEVVDSEREEKIELWMKNIREFIRNLDVKAL
jgi:hypothetical protein